MGKLSVMKEQAVVEEAAKEREISRTGVQVVPPGYKHTEVGVIPEDWEIKKLGEIANYTNGKAHEGEIKDDGKYISKF